MTDHAAGRGGGVAVSDSRSIPAGCPYSRLKYREYSYAFAPRQPGASMPHSLNLFLREPLRVRREINDRLRCPGRPYFGLRPRSLPQLTASKLWSFAVGALEICLDLNILILIVYFAAHPYQNP